jgi:uncharacterized damage-inducible protein DinB
MDQLDRQLGHDRWTTTRLLNLCQGLPGERLDQEFDIGHRTLRATFDHMLFAVELWTMLMDGGERYEIPRDRGSIQELRDRHERVYAAFATLARRLHDEGCLNDTFIDHHDYPQEIGATILQVSMHNQQHRSEILHILQRLGVPNLPDGDVQEWQHLAGRR